MIGQKGRRWLTSEDFPHRKDDDGKPLCRWCGGAVAPPRRSWCGDECVHQYNLRTSGSYLRAQVFKRDRGVCAECGCDTKRLEVVIWAAEISYQELCCERGPVYGWARADIWRAVFSPLGFNQDTSLWEADHVVEVVNKGETSLENIQTLCVPCHKAKTKRMHAELKEARTGIKPRLPVREVQMKMIAAESKRPSQRHRLGL